MAECSELQVIAPVGRLTEIIETTSSAAFIDPSRKLTVVGPGALTIVDASELTHSSIAETKEGRPVCLTNVRLHVLTAGGTFDLESRKASPPQE